MEGTYVILFYFVNLVCLWKALKILYSATLATGNMPAIIIVDELVSARSAEEKLKQYCNGINS